MGILSPAFIMKGVYSWLFSLSLITLLTASSIPHHDVMVAYHVDYGTTEMVVVQTAWSACPMCDFRIRFLKNNFHVVKEATQTQHFGKSTGTYELKGMKAEETYIVEVCEETGPGGNLLDIHPQEEDTIHLKDKKGSQMMRDGSVVIEKNYPLIDVGL